MTATNSDLAGLLRAVIERPEDDLLRLAYADVLDENAGDVECPESGCGNPAIGWNGFHRCNACQGTGRVSNGYAERAEFIRLQVREAELEWERIKLGAGVLNSYLTSMCIEARILFESTHNQHCIACSAKRSSELLSHHGERWAMEELVRPCGFEKAFSTEISDDDFYRRIHLRNPGIVRWHYSRGFINRIECTTETLMGMVCERCGGTNAVNSDNDEPYRMDECDTCEHSGRISGIAKALGLAVPVEEVVLMNLAISRGESQTYLVFYDEQQIRPLHMLTKQIKAEGWVGHGYHERGGWWNRWNSESAARSALAKAAALYCRSVIER